jgi:hypothetical protein
MAYETFRVEVTRDETRDGGAVTVAITAYIDRAPEFEDAGQGRLTRASNEVWNSRRQLTGHFDTLAAALAAVAAAHPEVAQIRCWEYSVDDEYPREVAPLLRSGDTWRPGEDPSPGLPAG